ncbi:Uncharacterised protein r2_g1870 [Pycnogonum litorale]
MDVKWTDFTIEALRAECKRRNLTVGGVTKDDLVAVLSKAVGEEPRASISPTATTITTPVSDTLAFLMENLSRQQNVLTRVLESNINNGAGQSVDPLNDDEDVDNYFAVFEHLSDVQGWVKR